MLHPVLKIQRLRYLVGELKLRVGVSCGKTGNPSDDRGGPSVRGVAGGSCGSRSKSPNGWRPGSCGRGWNKVSSGFDAAGGGALKAVKGSSVVEEVRLVGPTSWTEARSASNNTVRHNNISFIASLFSVLLSLSLSISSLVD